MQILDERLQKQGTGMKQNLHFTETGDMTMQNEKVREDITD